MGSIFYHIKKGMDSYLANFRPYVVSFLLIASSFISILFIGLLVILYNSQNIIYSDEFINNFANTGIIPFMLALVTPLNLAVFSAFFTLSGLLGIYLSSGLQGVCIEGTKGKASIRTFFGTIYRRGGSYLLATFAILIVWLILTGISIFPTLIVVGIESSLSAIPIYIIYLSIFAAVWFFMAPFVIFVPSSVVWGKSLYESWSQSLRIGWENYFELLALEAIIYAMAIAFSMIPLFGILLQIFLVLPLALFTLSSYYLDKSSERKAAEVKAEISERRIRKERRLPIETVLPRARKVKVSIIDSKPLQAEKAEPPKALQKPKSFPAPASAKKVPVLISMPSKKKKKKPSVYVVARKKPVRIPHNGEAGRKSEGKKKLKRPKARKKSRA